MHAACAKEICPKNLDWIAFIQDVEGKGFSGLFLLKIPAMAAISESWMMKM